MKIPIYKLPLDLAACWWRPLAAQGYRISQTSPKEPRVQFGPQEHGRFVADNVCEAIFEVTQQSNLCRDGKSYKGALLIGHSSRGYRPLYQAISHTLLASGAQAYDSTFDCEIMAVFPPGSDPAAPQEILARNSDLSAVEILSSPARGTLNKCFRVCPVGRASPAAVMDVGIGIEAETGAFLPYAALRSISGIFSVFKNSGKNFPQEIAQALTAGGGNVVRFIAPWPTDAQKTING